MPSTIDPSTLQKFPITKLLPMHAHLALPEVRELIESRDLATLSEILNEWLPADIASLLASLDHSGQDLAFQTLTGNARTQTFAYLDVETQLRFLKLLKPE